MYQFVKNQRLQEPLRGQCQRCADEIETRHPLDMPDHMRAGEWYTVTVDCAACNAEGVYPPDCGAEVTFMLTVDLHQFEE